MDPNLQLLLWAVYPLACFWFGVLCRSDIETPEGFVGGLVMFLAIIGNVVAIGFILRAIAKAFHLVP